MLLDRFKQRFYQAIWEPDLQSVGRWRAFQLRTVRMIFVVGRDVAEGQLTLRAMSLVYTTLLSLVPLLAVSFSVLKAFGVHNQVQPLLYNFLAPLGEKGAEIGDRIIGFVDNIKVGVLGSLGLAMLLYIVISLLQKIERTFNFIWRIRQPRRFAQRFSDYLSVILVGPVLIFSALGITASIRSTAVVQAIADIEPFGTLLQFGGQLIPYILIIAAFTFIYIFIPNTKVRFRSALTGAVISGVLWETAGWAFASFIVTSTKYAAIYSSFAILIMFMIWVYLGWIILLIGADVAFYHQNPVLLTLARETAKPNNRLRERVALLVMHHIGENFYRNRDPWTLQGLVNRVRVASDTVAEIIAALERRGLIVETANEPIGYVPARDMETITVEDILDAVRRETRGPYESKQLALSVPAVDHVVDQLDRSIHETLGEKTLKDLVRSAPGGDREPVKLAGP